MGLGYGLLSGLTKDVTGAQAGIADRKKLEQQAMHQMLADSLLKSQIQDTQSQSRLRDAQAKAPKKKAPPHTVWTDSGLLQYNDETGGWSPAKMDGAQGPGKPIRQPVKPTKGPTTKAPTVVDRETKAAARTALDLIGKMQGSAQQNMQNSQLPIATSVLRGVGRLPVVGDALKGMTEPAAQQFMSPKQAGYQQQADQLLHLASSVLPKGGRSVALLQNLRSSFTSAAGAKNPQAAQDALEELRKQISEVLGEDVPATAAKKYHPDNPYK